MQDDSVNVEVPIEVVEAAIAETQPEELPVDPNRLIEADVQLAREQEETERARIAARTAVKIAQIEAEEPPEWQNAMQEFSIRLAALETMMAESRQSLTPTQSTVVVTEPEAPLVETPGPEPEPEENEEVMPESQEAPEAQPEQRPRRRWI